MESSITKHQRNLSAVIHISTFSKYFFPFGNFIIPLILWTTNKNESRFVDYNGKQVINFQISILLYSIILGSIFFGFALFTAWHHIEFINIHDHNIHDLDFNFDLDFDNPFAFGKNLILLGSAGALSLGLLAVDIICTIMGTLRANDGVEYKYPLTINFIK